MAPLPGPSQPAAVCPRCGRRAGSRGEAWTLRHGLAVTWLVAGTGGPRPAVFCQGCVPAGPVISLECGFCGDGPLLVSEFGGGIVVGGLLAERGVRGWLLERGWWLDPAPVCPRCRQAQDRGRS